MFFNQMSLEYYDNYIINEWVSMWLFFEDISYEEYFIFQGNGFFSAIKKEQFEEDKNFFGYILKVNNRFFGFIGYSINDFKEGSKFKFKHIVEFSEEFINSDVFNIGENYFKPFEISIEVDIKFYSYATEERILLSKKGDEHIELYASYEYDFEKETIIGKVYPALLNAIKNKIFNVAIEERFSQLQQKQK